MTRELPLLTLDLARRLERLVAPEPVIPAPDAAPGAVTVMQFGRTIAAKARGGRPSNKVYCFGRDDVGRLDDILAFYAVDGLDPTFYLTSVGFSRDVSRALTAAGFAQVDFEQAILYGLPSTELTSPPRHVTIEISPERRVANESATRVSGF